VRSAYLIDSMLLADLSWDQAQEYLAHDNRLILPIGATEQHGRHLGLGCDFQIAEQVAAMTGEQTNVVVAPTIAYGMSLHHMKFAGTLSVRPTTLILVLEDVLRTAYAHGFRNVLSVNGHGGNTAAIDYALADVANEVEELRVKIFEWWKEPEILKMADEIAGPQRGTHSSPIETAFMMVARPNAVKMERAPKRDAPVERTREFLSARLFASQYPDGVMGLDPAGGSIELGNRLQDKSVEICVREISNW
jgi:creatinine amidohydrolase